MNHFKLTDLINGIITHDLANPLNIFGMICRCAEPVFDRKGIDTNTLMNLADAVRSDILTVVSQVKAHEGIDDQSLRDLSQRTKSLFVEFDQCASLAGSSAELDDLVADAKDEQRKVGHFLAVIDALLSNETPPFEMTVSTKILRDIAAVASSKKYTVQIQGDEFELWTVPLFVVSILEQFVRNAVEACQGIPSGTVTVSARYQSDLMTFTVSDSGKGMTPEQVSKLFTGYSSKSEEGHGLGLQIAHSLAMRCGYRLTVNSKMGQGTTVNLLIPAPV